MADSKALLLGLSAVGSLIAALQSRSARQKSEEQRQNLGTRAEASLNDSAMSNDKNNVDYHRAEEQCRSQNSPQWSNARLLIHGFLSIAVLAIAPQLKPARLAEEQWKQIIGLSSILMLTVHLFIVLVWQGRPAPRMAAQATDAAHCLSTLEGQWVKDKEVSDGTDAVCDLMQIHGIIRLAIGFIKGVKLSIGPAELKPCGSSSGVTELRIAVDSGILWFKINERYFLGGGETRNRRRDMRRGGSFGTVMVASGGELAVSNRFNDPYAGTMHELIYCPKPDVLHIDATVTVPGRGRVSYRQVYRRKL